MTKFNPVKQIALVLTTIMLSFSAAVLAAHSSSFAGGGRELLPRRISSQIMDLGRAYPIYMVAGMATLVVLPGPVTGIRTGNPESIQYFRPDKPENEVTVVLQNQGAKPTNLILRSGKKIYVFDVIPSKTVHQDVLEVLADYGGARFNDSHAELIDSSDVPNTLAGQKGGAQ